MKKTAKMPRLAMNSSINAKPKNTPRLSTFALTELTSAVFS